MKPSLLCFALFTLAFVECRTCRAEAEPSRVDAAQVCAIQAKIRWRESAWPMSKCEAVAAALNATADPLLMLALAVNESDLRDRAINVIRPGVYDLGIMGVRCVTLGAVAEVIGTSSSVASQVAPELARTSRTDGVTSTPRDRCTNGAARGLYAHQLLDHAVNIRTAAAVLASHGGSLTRYSGSTRERGYGARIAVLVAALGGELRIPKRATGAKWARVKELARRIVEAIGKERRS